MKDELISITNTIETETAIINRRSDGIMYFLIKKGIVFEPKEIEDLINATGKLGEEKKYGNVYVVPNDADITTEAREYTARKHSHRYTIATAFVITSLAHKIIGNFYLNVNKPPCPTKFFNNEKDAIKWLKEIM